MIKNEQERQRIGARITELRTQAGLTQVELAALTGLQQGHIARLEKGKYGVTIDVMSAIASAIGMTVDFVKKRKTNDRDMALHQAHR